MLLLESRLGPKQLGSCTEPVAALGGFPGTAVPAWLAVVAAEGNAWYSRGCPGEAPRRLPPVMPLYDVRGVTAGELDAVAMRHSGAWQMEVSDWKGLTGWEAIGDSGRGAGERLPDAPVQVTARRRCWVVLGELGSEMVGRPPRCEQASSAGAGLLLLLVVRVVAVAVVEAVLLGEAVESLWRRCANASRADAAATAAAASKAAAVAKGVDSMGIGVGLPPMTLARRGMVG